MAVVIITYTPIIFFLGRIISEGLSFQFSQGMRVQVAIPSAYDHRVSSEPAASTAWLPARDLVSAAWGAPVHSSHIPLLSCAVVLTPECWLFPTWGLL